MFLKQLIVFFCMLINASVLYTQEKSGVSGTLDSALSEKYADNVAIKISTLNRGIENKTFKMLRHLEKQERKIQKKLGGKDSVAAAALFNKKDYYELVKQ